MRPFGERSLASPLKFGSAMVGAALLLRGDAATPPPRAGSDEAPPPPRIRAFSVSLPAPHFGSSPPGPGHGLQLGEAHPALPPRAALRSSASREAIARSDASSPAADALPVSAPARITAAAPERPAMPASAQPSPLMSPPVLPAPAFGSLEPPAVQLRPEPDPAGLAAIAPETAPAAQALAAGTPAMLVEAVPLQPAPLAPVVAGNAPALDLPNASSEELALVASAPDARHPLTPSPAPWPEAEPLAAAEHATALVQPKAPASAAGPFGEQFATAVAGPPLPQALPEGPATVDPPVASAPPKLAMASASARPAMATAVPSPAPQPETAPGLAPSPDQPVDLSGPAAAGLPEPVFGQKTGLAALAVSTATERASEEGAATRQLPEPAFGKPAASPPPAVAPVPSAAPGPAPVMLAASAGPARGGTKSLIPQKPASPARNASTASLYGREDSAWDHAAGTAPGFGYDDELILEIRAGAAGGADTVIAYGTRSGVFLPMGALTRFLDLAITVSDDGHYASGWFLDESRTVTIDLRQGRLVLKDQVLPLAKGDAAAFDGELYLRAERFGDLFPLDITTDLRAQTVTIATREPFPFEERLARERERERLAARQGLEGGQRWPRDETPWKALDFPIADVQLRAASDSRLGTRGEGDMRLASDFAFVTAQAYVSGSTRDGLTAARLELGRRDPDARLFGPLGATEFQVGDVSMGALALGLRGTGGRGGFVTNAPLERASVFDQIDLRGDLQDGYEVELYRNNILIGSTRNAVNGRYEFLQVPVDYGMNVFRLVFYGPQGQRREEVRRLSVGDGRLGKGEFTYSLGALQKDVNLFSVYGPDFNRQRDFGAWRASGTMAYGISSSLTASMTGAWFETATQSRWMAAAGLRTGFAGLGARLDFGYQSGGGMTAQLGLAGRALGAGITLTHAEYRGDFIDEVRAFSNDRLRRATDLDVNASIRLGGGDNSRLLPLAARFRRLEFADGRKQTNAALRGSIRLDSFLVSNTLDFSGSSGSQGRLRSQLIGSFDLARLAGSRTQLRGAVGYAVLPDARLTSLSATVDRAIDERTMISGSVSHSFDGPDTHLGLSAVRRFDRFTLGVDGNYSIESKRYNVALRLGFSLGRNPLDRRIFFAQPGLASSGAVALRAYRDVNGDGRFGDGDSILPEVDFFSANQTVRTNPAGIALIGGLGSGNRASIQVDPDSLPDIALAPVTRGIEIVPRAGRVHAADFAIAALADIEGTARFSSEGRLREVSGLRLLLVDGKGRTVSQARSEADGFFLFERVLPGEYAIRVEPGQAERLNITVAEGRGVSVTPDVPVIAHDITVEPGSR